MYMCMILCIYEEKRLPITVVSWVVALIMVEEDVIYKLSHI